MSITPFLFLCFLGLVIVQVVDAWGKVGHQMVANIAWHRLSDQTRSIVKKILIRKDGTYGDDDDDAGSPLASVANWADKVRYTKLYHWTSALHYIDVQDEQVSSGCAVVGPGNWTDCHFVYERDCKNDFCAAGAIANYSGHLKAHRGHHIRRLRGRHDHFREDLEFVTHFVGDIHQPLHGGRRSDKGGNTIHVNFLDPEIEIGEDDVVGDRGEGQWHSSKKDWNLHSVWDDAMIEKALDEFYNGEREQFESDLIRNLLEKATANGDLILWLACSNGSQKECTSIWGEESLQFALSWAYRGTDGNAVVEGDTISGDYYYSRLSVVKQRIVAAGVRLASTLEYVLNDNGAVIGAAKDHHTRIQ